MSQQTLSRLAAELVAAVGPELADQPTRHRQARDHVLREIKADSHGGTRREWEDVERSLKGLAEVSRIRVQDNLADALEKASRVLQEHRKIGEQGWEGDVPVKMSNLPQHIQLLLNLANRPQPTTHAFAHSYLHRQPFSGPDADQLLYQEIMSEPFTGPHWGPGYNEEVLEGWTESEGSETSSASDEEVVTPSSKVVGLSKAARARLEEKRRYEEAETRLAEARLQLDKLKDGAYWKQDGASVNPVKAGLYGWWEMTTGTNVLSVASSISEGISASKVITAQQLQRELLFALTGRPGVMFAFDAAGGCTIRPGHPVLHMLSPESLHGVLASFAHRATQVASIRQFIAAALCPVASGSRQHSPQLGTTKTQPAFAEACRVELGTFDRWVADLEATLISGRSQTSASANASAASTPLHLRLELETHHGELLDHVQALLPLADSPVLLLDTLYTTLTSLPPTTDISVFTRLLDIFVASAEPVWAMLGDWLRRGMPVPSAILEPEGEAALKGDDDERSLDPEFFIQRDPDAAWADEDFWEAAYVKGEGGWPLWLGDQEVKDLVFEAGKARGLLGGLVGAGPLLEEWKEIGDVLSPVRASLSSDTPSRTAVLDITSLIGGYISPMCTIATFQLRRVLEEHCGLLEHLDAMEGLQFMKEFGIVDDWTAWLFQQMRQNKRWSDFQLLTSTLRDAVTSSSDVWINPILVRASASRRASENISQTVSAIKVDYQVPFPLSQLFTTTSMELRSDIFTFLLQLLHARRSLIDLASFMSDVSDRPAGELRRLWRLRHKLAWVFDTLWIWVTARVIALQTQNYRHQLSTLTSLRSMIAAELHHSRKIRNFCFLHESTAAVNGSISALLDMPSSLERSCRDFLAQRPVDGATTTPLPVFVQGRSRRRRRKARADDSSGESDLDDPRAPAAERTGGKETAIKGDILPIDGLAELLEEHVLALRNGVVDLASLESLEEDSGDVRATWGMLAFALEDWK